MAALERQIHPDYKGFEFVTAKSLRERLATTVVWKRLRMEPLFILHRNVSMELAVVDLLPILCSSTTGEVSAD